METIKGFIKVLGVDTYYEMAGKGEPLLLIHGVDSDSRMWDPQFNAFADHYQTIRFDLRGFGKTSMPPGEFETLDEINGMMAALGIESAHILGYSYGGTIAPSFAMKFPERVKSLILVGPGMIGYEWSEGVSNYFNRFQETYKDKNYEEMMRLLKWKSIYGPYREQEGFEDICQLLDEMFMHVVLHAQREGRPISPGDTRKMLSEVKAPTYILVGELDFKDYHNIANIYDLKIPNSIKEVFPNAAHFMNQENPALFNELVLKFLKSVE